MADSIIQFAVCLLGSALAGGLVGWLIRGGYSRRLLDKLRVDWQLRFETAARQRDKLNAQNIRLNSLLEAEKVAIRKRESAVLMFRSELESAHEQVQALTRNLATLSAEHDELKRKSERQQGALIAVEREMMELEAESVKAADLYKKELQKSFEKRTLLEKHLAHAKSEQLSLSNLLASAKSEHESASAELISASSRLEKLESVEDRVIALEAENAQLEYDANLAKQQIEALRRDVVELEALKVRNRELSHRLESAEKSRRQHEG